MYKRQDSRPLGLLERAADQGDPVAGDQLASLLEESDGPDVTKAAS